MKQSPVCITGLFEITKKNGKKNRKMSIKEKERKKKKEY